MPAHSLKIMSLCCFNVQNVRKPLLRLESSTKEFLYCNQETQQFFQTKATHLVLHFVQTLSFSTSQHLIIPEQKPSIHGIDSTTPRSSSPGQCKELCQQNSDVCKGIELGPFGRCEMWTHVGGRWGWDLRRL